MIFPLQESWAIVLPSSTENIVTSDSHTKGWPVIRTQEKTRTILHKLRILQVLCTSNIVRWKSCNFLTQTRPEEGLTEGRNVEDSVLMPIYLHETYRN